PVPDERGIATRVEREVLRHRQHGHVAAQDAPAGTKRQAGAQSSPTGLTRPVLPVTSSRPFAGNQDFGEWLSLVEHLVRDQGVAGSNPVSPTNTGPRVCSGFRRLAALGFWKSGRVVRPPQDHRFSGGTTRRSISADKDPRCPPA